MVCSKRNRGTAETTASTAVGALRDRRGRGIGEQGAPLTRGRGAQASEASASAMTDRTVARSAPPYTENWSQWSPVRAVRV